MLFLKYQSPATSNLGDDIQTLAAMQFQGNDGSAFVDRDQLSRYSGGPERLILNGWWTHDARHAWPPPEQVDGLPISMHVRQQSRHVFGTGAGFAWLKAHEPIGARDEDTFEWLRRIGVKSYWSACLTLTFPRSDAPRSGVILIDLDPLVNAAVREVLESAGVTNIQERTHQIKGETKLNASLRRRMAQEMLDLYAQASLVVTSRLHAALPCAALGTQVVLTGKGPRFSGMDAFVPVVPLGDTAALCDAVRSALRTPYVQPQAIDEQAAMLRGIVAKWKDGPAASVAQHQPAVPSANTPERVHVAVAFDQGLLEHAHVVCSSAAENTSVPLTIHAMTRDVSTEEFEEFRKRVRGNPRIERYEMDGHDWGTPRLGKWITASTMDRILLPGLLPNIAKAIYLDIDCVVLGDLAELYGLSTGESGIAAKSSTRKSFLMMSDYATRGGVDVERLKQLAGGDFHNFNAGVLLLDLDKLRAGKMTERASEFVAETKCNDQIALVAYAGDRYTELPPRWNAWVTVDHQRSETRPYGVLHYVGSAKPWNTPGKPLRHHWDAYAAGG